MITGAPMTPISVITNNPRPRVPAAPLTSSRTSAMSRWCLYSDTTGTNDWENAPSANRRRRKFGILYATRKASAIGPPPNNCACATSRSMPVMRDSRVVSPTTDVDLKTVTLITGRHYNEAGGGTLGLSIDKRGWELQDTRLFC